MNFLLGGIVGFILGMMAAGPKKPPPPTGRI